MIWPKGQEGIRGLQIDGECYKIEDEDEKEKAYEMVLSPPKHSKNIWKMNF